jgi:lipopolysaccharide export system permease protein
MSRLDRYVARIVAGAFAGALAFFLFLSIVIDVLNNMTRYSDRAARLGWSGWELFVYLLDYYARLTPVLFTTVTPFVTVIAGMFVVARLQGANEIVPMLFVGRRTQRVLQPLLVCGLLAAAAMAACWQWVVPHVGASLAADESNWKHGDARQRHLVHETFGDTVQKLYVLEFDPRTDALRGVQMLQAGPLPGDAAVLRADRAVWDATRGDWRLEGGLLHRKHRSDPQAWLERPDVTPAVLMQQSREAVDPELLSYSDLAEMVALRPNRPDVRLALHRHVTYPLANLVLLLLALPMAVWFERQSRIERLLTAIGLCAAFMIFDLICQSLGQGGMLHPILAAWSPTVVFGALGIALFGSIKT